MSHSLLIGTGSGIVIAHQEGGIWDTNPTAFEHSDISHAVYDPRSGALLAGDNSTRQIIQSDDFGRSWTPISSPLPVEQIWQIQPGRADEPGTIYVGVMPASMFRTRDHGKTWEELEGIGNHPTKGDWWPGAGGLCLHTIVVPPDQPGRVYAGISVAGVFRSDDDGKTWQPRNEGSAEPMVEDFEEFLGRKIQHMSVHRCVHKMVIDPDDSNLLYQQNHVGFYRSSDAADTWERIDNGLPSDFGFGVAVLGMPKPTVCAIPQDGYTLRTKEHLAVWRTHDRGQTWNESRAGLPAGEHNVLRDAMTATSNSTPAIYFGNAEGSVFRSGDYGETWTEILSDLPKIRSIEVIEA